MVPLLFFVSVISFVLIQLPPGDYLTAYMASQAATGEAAGQQQMEKYRSMYGLDKPIYVQYGRWIWSMAKGDLGYSMLLQRPVKDLIWDRLGMTTLIVVLSILASWLISLPIGIYAAVRQYGWVDYIASTFGLVGMATPPFLVALVLLFLSNRYLGLSLGGLYSDKYINAPWSWGKMLDLLKHLWLPVFILAIGATGSMIRTVRANLLDQLQMPYVDTARAKGLPEWKVVLKYPVRLAINPLVSTIGWMFPAMISAAVIVDVVLNLPTIGPLMLNALLAQDMYLAGAVVMLLSVLTMLGTLVSDVLLAWVDPRIRFEGGSR
jgi:peptide/nickel transport system permease protein